MTALQVISEDVSIPKTFWAIPFLLLVLLIVSLFNEPVQSNLTIVQRFTSPLVTLKNKLIADKTTDNVAKPQTLKVNNLESIVEEKQYIIHLLSVVLESTREMASIVKKAIPQELQYHDFFYVKRANRNQLYQGHLYQIYLGHFTTVTDAQKVMDQLPKIHKHFIIKKQKTVYDYQPLSL